MSASKSVDSARERGFQTLGTLYSGARGAYCTHDGCPDAIPTLNKIVLALGEDSNYLGFDCEKMNGILVKKQ